MSEANEMVSKFTASGAEKKHNIIKKTKRLFSDPFKILEEN